ncbi:sodium:proton antiporter [Labrys sp. WJW]|uniref:cation:proton antiporter domain-containing protein n=1 Tax=Labrys sp. WJW TaxID=1737983 RepID=UPI0008297979|nr:cation:proton antiporter [Labrys sp. WJW]OCC03454.1 sodium:proton antiporter [Labrys sp. WJW]
MPHETPLIATIVAGLGLAFIFALVAQRLRLSPIVAYLLGGVVIGPFTPGFVADQNLASELAELGVILLMFGVGLHFSLKDLLSVRAIAIPGALGQIAVATLLGMGFAWIMGWGLGTGLVFGLALSVASTVVLLRAMQERKLIETERGRIAVGWLIVEDLVMVITLVLIPPLAGLLGGHAPGEVAPSGLAANLGLNSIAATLMVTAIKVAAFVALMLVVGRKVIPWVLHFVAHTGSRELFRLAVLAISLGVAYGAAVLFGVSFALGAFFAGMVLAESPLSKQAANETLPLRDAFAVLFFVSVGMLFNPAILLQHPLAVLATFLIIVVGKSIAAFLIVRGFGYSKGVALTISASLAQIGEFSFILAVLGVKLQIIPGTARDLVVAGALISIVINPILFMALDRFVLRPERQPAAAKPETKPDAEPEAPSQPETEPGAPVAEAVTASAPPPEDDDIEVVQPTKLSQHAILVGHGRVGSRVAKALHEAGIPLVAIEESQNEVEKLKAAGIEVYSGPAGDYETLELQNLAGAKWLVVAIPDAFEAGHLVEQARKLNPSIRILARAHSEEAVDYLKGLGADVILMGEEEIARGMIRDLLHPVESHPGQAA